jgi:peroxiredoxin
MLRYKCFTKGCPGYNISVETPVIVQIIFTVKFSGRSFLSSRIALMEVIRMIAIGSKAPDFKLKDQNGKNVRLSSLRGKKVLLSFRPLAWTPVCTDQMKSLEGNFDLLTKLNTVALGIGVDSSPSNKAWAKALNIEKTRLVSDFWPHGEVSKLYGVFRDDDGYSERANIIIDEKGTISFTKMYPVGLLPDIKEIIEVLNR